MRLRVYTVSVITFPLMFYVLFGLVLNAKEAIGGTGVSTYLIATYGTFGVMGASLFGTASGLASDRGLGWLQVKRASPMPPFAYFAAKVILSMIFSAIVVALLLVLGIAFGGVRLPLAENGKAARNPGRRDRLPFSAMGLAIGYFAGPNSAPAAINLIYLPLSFCSGFGCLICFCLSWFVRSLWLFRLITCRNSRWELSARDATSRLQPTGRYYSPSP